MNMMTNTAEKLFEDLEKQTSSKTEELLQDTPDTVVQEETVSGFPVEDEMSNPAKIRLKAWLNAKEVFKKDIVDAFGVEPIAIVHSDIWSKLCQKLELFRLRVNNLGAIKANVTGLKELKASAYTNRHITDGFFLGGLSGLMIVMLLLALGSTVAKGILHFVISMPNESMILTCYIVFSGSLIGAMSGNREKKRALSKITSKHGELHILLPDMSTYTGSKRGFLGGGDSGPIQEIHNMTVVHFQKPPQEITPLLKQIARSNEFVMEVGVAPEAISFDINEEVSTYLNPIITLIRGNMVAVIAQFGEFPVEKIAVDDLLSNISTDLFSAK